MRYSLLFLLIAHFFGMKDVLAQTPHIEPCGYDQVMDNLEKQYPGFRKSYDNAYRNVLNSKSVVSRKTVIRDTTYFWDTIYTIPVVFHILYQNSTENIHDSLIYNQIEVLNQDFMRLNADTGNTRSIFKPVAGSARIKFELATTDPDGNATTGIIRKSTSKAYFSTTNDDVKSSGTGGNTGWNPGKYLNIWVCDTYNPNFGSIVLGYAYPPFGHPSWPNNNWVGDSRQGVVLHYPVVGRNNPLATGGALGTSNKGRVATHEVGHYLGLRHTWGDAQFSSIGCSVDDYIDDTPNQAVRSNFGCNFFSNTCTDPVNDKPDQVENYMDYSAHTCQNMFTKRQVQVMREAIKQYRTNLPIKTEIVQRMRIFDTVVYNDVKIFPVNKDQKVVVEVRNEDLLNTLKMDVYDVSGRKIYADLLIDKNESSLSTAAFAPGVYIFSLKRADSNKPIKTEKLLINKN